MHAFLEREDIYSQRYGTIAATAWNAARADKRKKTWRTWKDFFMPLSTRNRKRPGLTREEMLAQVKDMKRDFYGR